MSALSKLAIGCSRAGSLGNPTPLREIEAMWRHAVAAGARGFDTASIYAQGDSERALGRLLADHPATGLCVVTKAGFAHGPKAQLVRLAKPLLRPMMSLKGASRKVHQLRSGIDRQSFEPAFLDRCVTQSLRRLGVPSLPGFLLHDPPADVLGRPEMSRFLCALKTSGRARRVGVSLRDEGALRAALDLGSIDLLQVPITAYEAILGTGMAAEIRARGIHVTVRQVIRRPDGGHRPLQEAVRPLLGDDLVGSVLIGISTMPHLEATLREFAA